MEKRLFLYRLLLILAGTVYSLDFFAQTQSLTKFGQVSWAESVNPIHPGIPGEVPFWNNHAKRFIYAPAFDYKLVSGAVKYEYMLLSLADSSVYKFENKIPYAPLSPIWASVPVGSFQLTVTGISQKGERLGIAGKGRYYRAAPFNGPYHEPVMPYDESAKLALDNLLNKNYVEYWLKNGTQDPKYRNYHYPAKIWSALIVGAVTSARLKPNTPDAVRSIKLARIVADKMIDISYRKGTAWEFFAPTYYGKFNIKQKPHMDPANNFTIMGADAGHAYLDLYDYTKDKKYFEAARRIADTYIKNQMEDGSWYQFVNFETGKPVAPNIVIPTAVINYFDRLKRDYKVTGLEESGAAALKWIMENPVKTFNWQGQFEDIAAREPYRNHSREQACDLAVYLFKNRTNLELAEELVRFAEDQFVIWEKPEPFIVGNRSEQSGYYSLNWITPSVQEQYVFWMPVGRAAGIMADAYWEAYQATKKEIYLAKAKSIANAFTLTQKANNGDYPTFFTKYPMNLWLNSTVYPAKILMELNNNLKETAE